MRKTGFLMALLVMLLIMGGFAFAETATVTTTTATGMGSALSGLMTNTIIPLIVALAGGLVPLILLVVKKKLNVQLSAETEAWISTQAESAVQSVAEKAAARLKGGSIKLSQNEKLDSAIASLITKVPHLTREQADGYIHAAIARIPGVGATGSASLTVKTT